MENFVTIYDKINDPDENSCRIIYFIGSSS